jgi:hypothetical protein
MMLFPYKKDMECRVAVVSFPRRYLITAGEIATWGVTSRIYTLAEEALCCELKAITGVDKGSRIKPSQ